MSAEVEGIGQNCLQQWAGLVKSICRSGHNWSIMIAGASWIGQECLWDWEDWSIASVITQGADQKRLQEWAGFVKSVWGDGDIYQECKWDR